MPASPDRQSESPLPVGSIVLDRVSKHYAINTRASPRIGSWLLNKAFEYFRRERFTALEELSFRIEPGEMVALIGANGAGKSTALKLIAGIIQPSSGAVSVSGQVTSLLELGIGFHPDLTGMENIFQSGIMLGLSRRRILERLERIVDFSGISDFLDEPVKHYSSGMYSRLACSVALHLDPQIILLDEILAVGDVAFQQKGVAKILELHRSGVTVVLVTHETTTAQDICDRLIWIEDGRLRDEGDPIRVGREYLRAMSARAEAAGPFRAPVREDPDMRIGKVECLVDGRPAQRPRTGDSLAISIQVDGRPGPLRVGISWRWEEGVVLTEDLSPPFHFPGGAHEIVYSVPHLPLIRHEIVVAVVLCDGATGEVLCRRSDALTLHVETEGTLFDDFAAGMNVEWALEDVE